MHALLNTHSKSDSEPGASDSGIEAVCPSWCLYAHGKQTENETQLQEVTDALKSRRVLGVLPSPQDSLVNYLYISLIDSHIY